MMYKILVATLAIVLAQSALAQNAVQPIQHSGTSSRSQTKTRTSNESTSQTLTRTQSLNQSETFSRSKSETSEFGTSTQYGLDQIAVALVCWQKNDPAGYSAWSKAAESIAEHEIKAHAQYVDELFVGASDAERHAAETFWALGNVAHLSASTGDYRTAAVASRLMAVGMDPVTHGCVVGVGRQ